MKLKALIAAGLMGATLFGYNVSPAAAEEAAQPADTAGQSEEFQVMDVELPYTYTSRIYGYTIQCPQKPLGVISASDFYGEPEKSGEVLVFDNVEYDVTYGWVILRNAFDNSVPDLNTISEEQANELFIGLMNTNPYSAINLVAINNYNKCIYAITSKEIQFDSDGDGIADATATADSQNVVTFFRGTDGGRYSVQLIDKPELNDERIAAFNKALTTFKPAVSTNTSQQNNNFFQ